MHQAVLLPTKQVLVMGGGERGQTLVEYALILLFVSTALVFTLGGLTADIKATLESVVAGF